MPSATMAYVLSNITQNIPAELLGLAFKPQQFNTTVEQRIIAQIVEGPILLDTNLVGGKRRELYLRSNWLLDLDQEEGIMSLGGAIQGAFYKVPAEAREDRNISSVIGITSSLAGSAHGSGYTTNGAGGFGNTLNAMTSQMLNSRTFAQYPVMPNASLEGTNIIRLFPKQLVSDVVVTVMLEYDSEFINLEPSAIFALSDLCLCATKRYIANTLRVSVDETEVVAGMEIGIIKQLIEEYAQDGKEYDTKLMKFKGAAHFDKRSLGRMIYHAL